MPLHITSKQTGVLWKGSFFVHHSLALVNRELTLALLDNPEFISHFELGLEEFEPAVFGPEADARFTALDSRLRAKLTAPGLTVRHHWPPNFVRPATGKLVVIQPWEFGSLPRQWVPAIAQNVEEIWVPSQFVRDTYLQSGVSAEKVVVVPNGVNTQRFHPNVTPFDFRKNPATADLRPETFKFLFVGGTIARKGIDVLLAAYENAFTAQDDVALIVKDFGTDSFYANQGAGAAIRALQEKPGAPRVVYLNADLSEDEIAGLYAACDCLAHPYRGEGYGLPIAEAMACGKPTLVTGYGAALDFANSHNAYLIPASRQRLPQKQISGMETVDYPYWAEPDRNALTELLRRVAANRAEAEALGAQAAQDIAARHTWTDAARIAADRLVALSTEAVAPTTFALPMGLSNLSLGGLNSLPVSADAPGLMPIVRSYEERKQEALVEIRDNDYESAVVELEACLSERPHDWDVVNALAVALFRTGKSSRALTLLEKGIQSAPNPRDFHHNMAFILLSSDRQKEALDHALAALALTPHQKDIRRTVERAAEVILKAARKILRGYPDSKRDQGKRDPQYRALMERYRRAEEALKAAADAPLATGLPIQNPNAPLLSVCMIVKNEERFLRNCLESVREVADEIVIVDTGSTDSTLDIAREFGATIVTHAWNDDFSEARNVSLAHATGRWALWLDADEEIAPESKELFRKTIENAPAEVGAYMVMFRNWLQSTTRDPHSELAIHHACRLFRLVPGVRFQGRIHEQNLRSLQELGYTYKRQEGLILDHFGYSGEIMTLRNKHERFIRMLTREVEECPDENFRQFHLFNLGNAYFTQGDMENAAYYLGLAAEDPDVAEEFTVTLFVELATALHRLGRSAEGLEVCAQADKLGIVQAGIEFARGYCLLHRIQYPEAENAFYAAIRMGALSEGEFANSGDAGVSGFKAWYGVGLALVGQDRYFEAQQACETAVEQQPNFVDARYLLGLCLLRQGQREEAKREYIEVLAKSPNHPEALEDLSALLYADGDYETALPYLRRVAQADLNNYDVQARLASCCERLGLIQEAKQVYERLRTLSPMSPEICVNLGRVLAATGSTAEAINCFTDAIQLDPAYGNAYFNAGDLLYKLGYYTNAADAYLSGLEVEPHNASGFFTLGNCYFHTEDYAAAIVSYKQALLEDPNHTEARNNLELAQTRLAQAV